MVERVASEGVRLRAGADAVADYPPVGGPLRLERLVELARFAVRDAVGCTGCVARAPLCVEVEVGRTSLKEEGKGFDKFIAGEIFLRG